VARRFFIDRRACPRRETWRIPSRDTEMLAATPFLEDTWKRLSRDSGIECKVT
jgi:hypothetical protein